MLKKSDFDFYLPKELIAQTPLAERSASRLLVLDKKTGKLTHQKFTDIKNYLSPGDCLVLNNTKVIPARLTGIRLTKGSQGGAVEVTLLKRTCGDKWEALVKPGRKMKINDSASFGNGILECKVLRILDDGIREIEFSYNGIFEEILDRLGEMPLPPYITERLADKSRYQTVYAKHEGAAAAATAGLHFTNEFLSELNRAGIETAFVTLHVGLGTFRPVKEDIITDHKMHDERYCIESEQAEIINNARKRGKKIVAVGTTSVRTLESSSDENGFVIPQSGSTDIFIYPGCKLKATDALITNFHLPQSTLIMLVSAFAGRENVLRAYEEAVNEKYRFFSFGDCMMIV